MSLKDSSSGVRGINLIVCPFINWVVTILQQLRIKLRIKRYVKIIMA